MPGPKPMRECLDDTDHYVSTAGKSENTGTMDSPWDLSYAASGADGCIKPGHTVWVRGGTYRPQEVKEFKISVSGTADEKITFKQYPGETVILDGSIPEFTTSDNTAWLPHETRTGHNVYRSAGAVEKALFYGGFIQIAGEWYSLAPHVNDDYLLSDTHVWKDGPSARYLGPGISQSPDGHLLIRLDTSSPEAQLGRPVPQIIDPDPRQHPLYICSSRFFGLKITGSHLVIEDFAQIDHFGGCFCMDPIKHGQTDVTIRNCGGRPIYFGMRCAAIDGLTLDSCKFYAHMPGDEWWVAHSDIKVQKKEKPPAGNVRKVGLDLGAATHVEVVDCIFDEFFDGILAGAVHDVEIHRTLFNHIWDDAWQMHGNIYNINFHHNFCYGAGPSVDDPQANEYPGTIYIHHNVIDTTTRLLFWGRLGSPDARVGESNALPSHISSTAYAWPRKFYYNTIVTGQTAGGHDVGWDIHGKDQSISQTKHEVYNNIFNVIDGRPGGRDFDANSGNEIYDGNVYWHYHKGNSPSDIKSPWRILHMSGGVAKPLPADVIELRASQAYRDSQAYYAPGWEKSGLSEDPKLDWAYKPHNAACQTGAVDLTMKDWPGTAPYEAWRGAINPFPGQETAMSELVLFEHAEFHGIHTHLYDSEPNLNVGDGSIFNNTLSSFVITSGNWQFFTGPNFSGHGSSVVGPGRYDAGSIDVPNGSMGSVKKIS